MIKHIFCDLDGTLLKEFYKIDEEDINALKLAEKKGITISIATGRLDYEIKMLMHKYNFKGYRISQNGAIVFDDNNNLVHEVSLSIDDIKTILESIKGQKVLVFFQTIDSYIVQEKISLITEFEKTQPFITYIENKNIYNELDKHDFVTISLWTEKDYNLQLKKQLDKVLPSHIVSYISSRYTLDITNRVNSKGNGIMHLCKKSNIILEDIAVIGDSQNDISMFNITENSFVMNEAIDEVKKYANYSVDSVKDAVYELIKNR